MSADSKTAPAQRVLPIDKPTNALVPAGVDVPVLTTHAPLDSREAPPPYPEDKPITIPTHHRQLTSGFKFQESLLSHGITEAEWNQFTHELHEASKLRTSQKFLAVMSGIGLMAIGTPGHFARRAGRKIWLKQTMKNINEGLQQEVDVVDGTYGVTHDDVQEENGKKTVAAVLKVWNERWAENGVKVKLGMPQLRFHDRMEYNNVGKGRKGGYRARKEAMKFKLIVEPLGSVDGVNREIVIDGELHPADQEPEEVEEMK